MQVIDAHTHIMPPAMIADRQELLGRDDWFKMLYENPRGRLIDGLQLIEAMDRTGVAQSIAFGFAFNDVGLCRLCNDYVLETAEAYPDRIIPFALTNPTAGVTGIKEAQRCLEKGAQGLGELMPNGQGFSSDSKALTPLLALTRERDVPVMLHVNEQVGHQYAGKGSFGPQQAYQLAESFPENLFIFAHWGGGLPFFALMPEVEEVLHNVYYDTAASLYLYRDEIFEYLIRQIPDRILFGTDYPLIDQKLFLRRIHRTALTSREIELLLCLNAEELLTKSV